MKTRFKLLGDLVRFEGGGTPSRQNESYWDGDLPWASVKDFKSTSLDKTQESITRLGLSRSSSRLIPPNTVVIPTRMALGKAAITCTHLAINQDLKAVYPLDSDELDTRFLLWFFICSANKIEKLGSGATVKGITLEKLNRLEIPLPPLPEQKRIAAILDKADAIRRKRKEAIDLSDEFLRSVFLDMFGDPVTNPKGWEKGTLSEIVGRFQGGKNLAESNSPTKVRVLKVSAVTTGIYLSDKSKFVPDSFEVPESYLVKAGDLLISRANTQELIGACAYVWETPENIMLPDKIWRFVWDDSCPSDPHFIHHLLQHRGVQREIGKRSSGTSGSMKNIAKPKLLSVPIILPPLELQKAFGDIVKRRKRVNDKMGGSAAALKDLFASLQQRAFRGEL